MKSTKRTVRRIYRAEKKAPEHADFKCPNCGKILENPHQVHNCMARPKPDGVRKLLREWLVGHRDLDKIITMEQLADLQERIERRFS